MFRCPRDHHQLVPQPGGSAVWRCEICSGGFTEKLPGDDPLVPDKSPREEWNVEIRCPRDGVTMERYRRAKVHLTQCPKCHAVWLDGDEIAVALGRAFSVEAPHKARENEVNLPMTGANFWVTLPGTCLLTLVVISICVPIGVFLILPLSAWTKTGIWAWPTHESLVLALKLSVVAVLILGPIQWAGYKFGLTKRKDQGE